VRVGLKGQKQVFWTIVFSVGFFVYGITATGTDTKANSIMMAKAHAVSIPSRGIASE